VWYTGLFFSMPCSNSRCCYKCISSVYPYTSRRHSKESPPNEKQNEEADTSEWSVLAEQQLPINAHRSSSILGAILSQSAADLAHTLETVSTIQQVLDILGHDLGYVAELIVQLVEVLRGAGIGVGGLSARDEGVELHKGVRTHGAGEDLLQGVGCAEFGGEVGEVGEG
jgi:hypothetical protein